MKTEVKSFDLADFMLLKQDKIHAYDKATVDIMVAFEQLGLVMLYSQERRIGGKQIYIRTGKGVDYYNLLLTDIENRINYVLMGGNGGTPEPENE
jgi:hypothetical protein